jgi:predicted alpha/beta-hydrolase family hydrolase
MFCVDHATYHRRHVKRDRVRTGTHGVAAFLAIAAVVVTGWVGSAAGSTTRGSTTTKPASFARLVDIGTEREVYLQCRGRGSPTVVLVSGAGGAHDEWTHGADAADPAADPRPSRSAVFPQVARFTRVCAYDRPGTTRMNDRPSPSSSVDQPTTAQAGADDLGALLERADQRGPYVLVGASWGGMIVNLFARENPTDVAGLVFVDGASDFLKDALTPEQWTTWMQLIATSTQPGREAPDYEASVAEIRAAPPVPDVPAVVLTAEKQWDLPLGDAGSTWPAWLAAQDQLTNLLRAKHVTNTKSGHGIAVENPRAVVNAIRDVVHEARS